MELSNIFLEVSSASFDHKLVYRQDYLFLESKRKNNQWLLNACLICQVQLPGLDVLHQTAVITVSPSDESQIGLSLDSLNLRKKPGISSLLTPVRLGGVKTVYIHYGLYHDNRSIDVSTSAVNAHFLCLFFPGALISLVWTFYLHWNFFRLYILPFLSPSQSASRAIWVLNWWE